MATVCGNYVDTFLEASHALPEGMHMNADYPFKLPLIAAAGPETVCLMGDGGSSVTCQIKRGRRGEYCEVEQSSSFERLYGYPPKTFKCFPFKDDGTPAIGESPKLQEHANG